MHHKHPQLGFHTEGFHGNYRDMAANFGILDAVVGDARIIATNVAANVAPGPNTPQPYARPTGPTIT